MPAETGSLFAVEHVDENSQSRLIRSDLTLEEAVELAREVAGQRRLGRMFRAGSAHVRNVIVITERPATDDAGASFADRGQAR